MKRLIYMVGRKSAVSTINLELWRNNEPAPPPCAGKKHKVARGEPRLMACTWPRMATVHPALP